jgi:hypothetical protein
MSQFRTSVAAGVGPLTAGTGAGVAGRAGEGDTTKFREPPKSTLKMRPKSTMPDARIRVVSNDRTAKKTPA